MTNIWKAALEGDFNSVNTLVTDDSKNAKIKDEANCFIIHYMVFIVQLSDCCMHFLVRMNAKLSIGQRAEGMKRLWTSCLRATHLSTIQMMLVRYNSCACATCANIILLLSSQVGLLSSLLAQQVG